MPPPVPDLTRGPSILLYRRLGKLHGRSSVTCVVHGVTEKTTVWERYPPSKQDSVVALANRYLDIGCPGFSTA